MIITTIIKPSAMFNAIVLAFTCGCARLEYDGRGHDVIDVATSSELLLNVDLGIVKQGDSLAHRCWLRNTTKSPLQIVKLTSSCECVSVSVQDYILNVQERTLLTIHFDGTKESDFTGSLAITVEAADENGSVVARLNILADIIADQTVQDWSGGKSVLIKRTSSAEALE